VEPDTTPEQGTQEGAADPTEVPDDHGVEPESEEEVLPNEDDELLENFPVTAEAAAAFANTVKYMGLSDAESQTQYCSHLVIAVSLEHPSATISCVGPRLSSSRSRAATRFRLSLPSSPWWWQEGLSG
jgi:hypothetical protein